MTVNRLHISRQDAAQIVAINATRDISFAKLGIGQVTVVNPRTEPVQKVIGMIGDSGHVARGDIQQMFFATGSISNATTEWILVVDELNAERAAA